MTGREVVKHFESCKLSAYLCPAGIPTIGWGHTKGVKLGDTITQEQADLLFEIDYADAEDDVKSVVTVPLTDNQLGALTSFVFNLGLGALKTSTLLKKLNSGDSRGAAEEFRKWVYADHKVLAGLVKRREMERMVFLDA